MVSAPALFLVDVRCRIVHANAAGQGILEADDFLRSIGGHLVARDGKINQNLREIVANNGGETPTQNRSVLLVGQDGESYVAHLMPLKAVVRSAAKSPAEAAAALFVRKVEIDGQSYGGSVARAFGLTPAELRVLTAIVEVGGVPESSQKLGLAETTVKTHLSRVFSKTGASRQADLVKLAAGFSNPLAN
jgi:DNA-binding CsgD family transcriptional regulator